MNSLYIVMPAYNEEANIESVVKQWYPILEMSKSDESRLVIADNGSTDSTHQILLDLQKNMKNWKFSRIQENNTDLKS